MSDLPLPKGSLQIKNYGDEFLLLRSQTDQDANLPAVGRAIFEKDLEFVDEVIATEVEICLQLNDQFDRESLLEVAAIEQSVLQQDTDRSPTCLRLPILFSDAQDDWTRVADETGLARADYIEQLLACDLRVAMTGFLPGFVYLGGLPNELQIPRKANPDKRTSANAFAIGGRYAGIYSLPSPAGWNVIGALGVPLLQTAQLPPLVLQPGDAVKLESVDEAEWQRLAQQQPTLHEYNDVIPPIPEPTRSREPTIAEPSAAKGSATIVKPGLLTLLQDQGRHGLAYYAIPRSGPLDPNAADLANVILCNPPAAPVIECHFLAPKIRFETTATICLTGADMQWQIDGRPVKRQRTISVPGGSTLTGSASQDACRSYVGIRGSIQTQKTLGSAACYPLAGFGGNHGKPFAAGDVIQWDAPSKPPFPLRLDLNSLPSNDEAFCLLPGPEFEWLDDASENALAACEFSISADSNRMGARLDGPALSTAGKVLSDSVPLLPGMIQLTPAGQCIVVLQDGQTTGGYPRIAYLNAAALNRLNQTPLRQAFRFEICE